ncbi:MAG TPA: universal stress protein [Planctomycetota bacterium]
MPAKILVALDGTRTSESILPYVEFLLRYQDADLTLATVSPPGKAVEDDYLRETAERLNRKGAVVSYETLSGHPADALVAFAAGGRFDLLALCSRKAGLKRLLFGSVAEEILRTSTVPVFVVPPAEKREAPPALNKILLPLDGSHRSASILKPAAVLAKAFGAKLCFVTVVAPTKKDELPVETVAHNLFRDQKALRDEGLDVDVAVLYGDPVDRVLAYAEENNVDLIGLATHGRGGLNKLRYGNVAESLLRKSHRAMLVVRTAAIPKTKARSSRALKAKHHALETMAAGGDMKKGPYNR